MSFEQFNPAPQETADLQSPTKEDDTASRVELNTSEIPEPPTPRPEEQARATSSLEKFHPTPENPIAEIRIGLYYNADQYFRPTRVVMKLKDGTFADMPWDQAEAILPPEFRIARELGENGRELGRQINDLITAVQTKTDVMHRSGHVKDALLGLLGQTRKPLQYLNEADKLKDEVSDVAQQSFLEMRRMAKSRESHANELQILTERLAVCQNKFNELSNAIFQDKPLVRDQYQRFRDHPAAKFNRGVVINKATAEESSQLNDSDLISS